MADAERAHEAGVSLIEALVMTAVLAIVAVLALDLARGGAARAFLQAGASADRAGTLLAGEHFVRIVANAVGPGAIVDGDAERLVIATAVAEPGRCRAWPAEGRLVLRIVQNDDSVRLTCTGARGEETLGHWRGRRAQFSYSVDGSAWQASWRPAAAAPFVRLSLSGSRTPMLWMARPALTRAATSP